MKEADQKPSRAIVAAVQLSSESDTEFEASLTELRQLAKTLGYEVAGTFTQKRASIGAAAKLAGPKDRARSGTGGRSGGESHGELDRRKIRDRIAELQKELDGMGAERKTQRARRGEREGLARVALVGYTNAGKSTLMRALTGSEALVADKLFATLDTTVRALHPETVPRVLVSDTVGFIKNLPHGLVASFKSTLDEALEASLRGQIFATCTVLEERADGEGAFLRVRGEPETVKRLREELAAA